MLGDWKGKYVVLFMSLMMMTLLVLAYGLKITRIVCSSMKIFQIQTRPLLFPFSFLFFSASFFAYIIRPAFFGCGLQTEAAKPVLGEYYKEPKKSGALPWHLFRVLAQSLKQDHYVSDTGDVVYYQAESKTSTSPQKSD
jgi:hypothetical protein